MSELGMVIRGESKGGRLCLEADEQARLVQVINDNPGALELIVRKPSNPRSMSQNKYYWGVVIKPIADYCGSPAKRIHELLKERFLEPGVSTKTLSTKDFDNYIEQIKAWAVLEYNIIIPDPEQVTDTSVSL